MLFPPTLSPTAYSTILVPTPTGNSALLAFLECSTVHRVSLHRDLVYRNNLISYKKIKSTVALYSLFKEVNYFGAGGEGPNL